MRPIKFLIVRRFLHNNCDKLCADVIDNILSFIDRRFPISDYFMPTGLNKNIILCLDRNITTKINVNGEINTRIFVNRPGICENKVDIITHTHSGTRSQIHPSYALVCKKRMNKMINNKRSKYILNIGCFLKITKEELKMISF